MKQKYRELGKLDIGINEWTRFEELADREEFLWNMFWTIAGDKKELSYHKICKRGYFEVFVIPALVPRLKIMSFHNLVEDADDLDIILSLYLKLIPERDCVNCNCQKIEANLNEYIG